MMDLYRYVAGLPRSGSDKDPYKQYRSTVPPGVSGDRAVDKFDVEPCIEFARMIRDGRWTPVGTYTRLLFGRSVMMSDTDAEIRDCLPLFYAAKGRVLMNGLGLGVAAMGCLVGGKVESVDVVEIDPDVIKLVLPYMDKRIKVHQGDAFTFKWGPGLRWDVVWHDIWPTICSDHRHEISALKRKYARRCDWQGVWCEEWAKAR